MTIPPLIALIASFALWSLIFILFYAAQATGCHLVGGDNAMRMSDPYILRAVLSLCVAVASVAMLLLFLKSLRLRRQQPQQAETTSSFFSELATYVWAAALFATPFCFGGVAWLTLCGT
mgnify:CR=1 FL=1|jgi:hypothetical protein